jgi:hypothetical protein
VPLQKMYGPMNSGLQKYHSNVSLTSLARSPTVAAPSLTVPGVATLSIYFGVIAPEPRDIGIRCWRAAGSGASGVGPNPRITFATIDASRSAPSRRARNPDGSPADHPQRTGEMATECGSAATESDGDPVLVVEPV